MSGFLSVLTWMLLLAATPKAAAEQQQGPQALLARMQRAEAALQEYTCVLLKQELSDNTLSPSETLSFKYRKPGRTYLTVTSGPRQGAELLYGPGWNGGKVRAHKGSFPDITLDLDPRSGLLMKDQHHTIDQLGFGPVVQVLERNVDRARRLGQKAVLSAAGQTLVAGRPAHLLELRVPFLTQPHVVQKGEDLWSIAQRYGQDMYVVMHENPQLEKTRKPSSVKAGDVVQVPVFYSPHTIVAVDDRTGLPARLEVYDSKDRLYELYEWSAVNLAPHLTDADFSPDNPAYHF